MDWSIFAYLTAAVATGAVSYLVWPKHRRRRFTSENVARERDSQHDGEHSAI
jgi:hypothetical protein